jgi:hypothetical protein
MDGQLAGVQPIHDLVCSPPAIRSPLLRWVNGIGQALEGEAQVTAGVPAS